ncbi:MAG: hypothetical protein CL761_04235 [Chloroflexi bacterium]|nr:hypothetical protein [Chloroflexota bacterium]
MKRFFIVSAILTSFFIVSTDEIYAHQPYEIKNSTDQTIIELSDATVSHAYYGEFLSDQEEIIFDLKGFSAPILQFSILIPDKSPENIFSPTELPEVKLLTESKDEMQFLPYERIGFYEPYSRMNLIRVITYRDTNYNDKSARIIVKSNKNCRFVFSVGYKEIFNRKYSSGDTVELGSSGIQTWYSKTSSIEDNPDLEESLEIKQEESSLRIIILIISIITVCLVVLYLFRNKILNKS